MAKLPNAGDLVFFGDMLVGYIETAVEKEGNHILTVCVPYVDLPPAKMIKTIPPKHITLKAALDENKPEKKKPKLLVPAQRILGSDGRPAQ